MFDCSNKQCCVSAPHGTRRLGGSCHQDQFSMCEVLDVLKSKDTYLWKRKWWHFDGGRLSTGVFPIQGPTLSKTHMKLGPAKPKTPMILSRAESKTPTIRILVWCPEYPPESYLETF